MEQEQCTGTITLYIGYSESKTTITILFITKQLIIPYLHIQRNYRPILRSRTNHKLSGNPNLEVNQKPSAQTAHVHELVRAYKRLRLFMT